jgi:hypothetical protein
MGFYNDVEDVGGIECVPHRMMIIDFVKDDELERKSLRRLQHIDSKC